MAETDSVEDTRPSILYARKYKGDIEDEKGNNILVGKSDMHAEACAKTTFTPSGQQTYLIRKDPHGGFRNHGGIFAGSRTRMPFEDGYVKVTPQAFAYYLAFLRTDSIIHLKNAERTNVG